MSIYAAISLAFAIYMTTATAINLALMTRRYLQFGKGFDSTRHVAGFSIAWALFIYLMW